MHNSDQVISFVRSQRSWHSIGSLWFLGWSLRPNLYPWLRSFRKISVDLEQISTSYFYFVKLYKGSKKKLKMSPLWNFLIFKSSQNSSVTFAFCPIIICYTEHIKMGFAVLKSDSNWSLKSGDLANVGEEKKEEKGRRNFWLNFGVFGVSSCFAGQLWVYAKQICIFINKRVLCDRATEQNAKL